MKVSRLERGTYCGGQQAAAVIGAHPFMTAHDVYNDTVNGRMGDRDGVGTFSSNPAMRRGSIIEPGLLEWVKAKRGVSGDLWATDQFYVDHSVPFMAGTVDAVEMAPDGSIEHIHETTSTTTRSLSKWGFDGEPNGALAYKWVQTQFYLGITGAKSATIWLFVTDTGEIREYPTARNDAAIASIRDAVEAFWLDCVMERVPPHIDHSAMSAEALEAMFSVLDRTYEADPTVEAPVTEEIVAAAHEYDAARKAMDVEETRKRAAGTRLKLAMLSGTKCQWDGGRISWSRNRETESFDKEAMITDLCAKLALSDDEKQ